MILRVRDDEIVIISEDSMDVKYLESLFEDSVYFVKELNFRPRGFSVTDERVISVKIVKDK